MAHNGYESHPSQDQELTLVDNQENIYAVYLKLQSKWLAMEGFKVTYSPDKTKTAVIVEPRPHPMMRAVVDNIMSSLGPAWNLHIFTSSQNKEWLAKELEPHEYMVNVFNMPNITREQYSELLMTASFWKLIRTEDILIFQTDCIAFRMWDPSFEVYDYVGANYYHPQHILGSCGGIQGGLSFRKKSAMLECLEKITPDTINQFRKEKNLLPITAMAEDVYYTHACALLHKNTMDAPLRHYFAIEAEYFLYPYGFHGWQHPYFSVSQTQELLKGSPFFRKFLFA